MEIAENRLTNEKFTFREYKPEENPFDSIIIDLTHRCNMNCANCYIPNRYIPDMEIDRLMDLLRRLPRRTNIRLMGAEATVRRDLPEIVSSIRCLGHRMVLVTNGLKLADSDYCRTLHASGLRLIGISMNAADDERASRIIDNGVYAKKKVQALVNCFRQRFFVGNSMIVARHVNEHLIKRQVDLFYEAADEAGVDLSHDKPYRSAPMVLRFKSIGPLGRYMKGSSIPFPELVRLVRTALSAECADTSIMEVESGVHKIKNIDDCVRPSVAIPINRPDGKIVVKILNWSADESSGLVDPGNLNRGRVTEDFMLAPAMEHIKANEFQY